MGLSLIPGALERLLHCLCCPEPPYSAASWLWCFSFLCSLFPVGAEFSSGLVSESCSCSGSRGREGGFFGRAGVAAPGERTQVKLPYGYVLSVLYVLPCSRGTKQSQLLITLRFLLPNISLLTLSYPDLQ